MKALPGAGQGGGIPGENGVGNSAGGGYVKDEKGYCHGDGKWKKQETIATLRDIQQSKRCQEAEKKLGKGRELEVKSAGSGKSPHPYPVVIETVKLKF